MARMVRPKAHHIPNSNNGGRPVALQIVAAEGAVESLVVLDATRTLIRGMMRALCDHDKRLATARIDVQAGATAADALALSMIPQAQRRAA